MKWWKKALIWTGILVAAVAALAFFLDRQVRESSPDPKIREIRDEKMSNLCGQIFGAGLVIIWVVAYKTKDR